MTAPRQILPGSTYLVTRRCSQRMMLLRPEKEINNIVKYCAAYAAQKFGVDLHGAGVIGDHMHYEATDPHGEFPRFTAELHRLVAKCVNAKRGRFENLWAPGACSVVRLETPEDCIDKLVYIACNPVAAELVQRRSEWPGWITGPSDYSKPPETIRRPKVYFRDNGIMPEQVELKITPPPGYKDMPVHEFQSMLAKRIRTREDEIIAEVTAAKRRFMGREAVLRESPTKTAKSPARRFERNPHIACRDEALRLEALARRRKFLDDYRAAWEQYVGGKRTVTFPAGTYWMAKVAKCRSAAPDSA